MEKEDFLCLRFILMRYFSEKEPLDAAIIQEMSYVEIDNKDMVVIRFLFGECCPDKETQWLAYSFPERLFFPWKNSFTIYLHLCDDFYGHSSCVIPVRLESKMKYC